MINAVAEASVVSLMRTYEQAAFDVLGLRVFAWNRRAGPTKNKNYKVWARLRMTLDVAHVDVALFMWDALRLYQRVHPADAAKRPPFVTQLSNPAYMREHARRSQRPRAQVTKLEFYTWEIDEGVEIVRGFAGSGLSYKDTILHAWMLMPPTFCAIDGTYYNSVTCGEIMKSGAPEHYDRITEMFLLLGAKQNSGIREAIVNHYNARFGERG